MPTRSTPFAAGTPCWVDLFTSDIAKSREFYGGLFGWTAIAGPDEFGGYTNFYSDGHQVAGVMQATPDVGMPDVWSTYMSSDDIDASVTVAEKNGASVMSPAMQVGDLGSMAILTDPANGVFGIWQPGLHTGFGKYNEPGSVIWNEYLSRHFAATTPFYATVFGWDVDVMSDTDDFRYSNGQVDGSSVAGMMDAAGFLPDGVPSHWGIYFCVADTDESVAKVLELGGSVILPAADTPFGRIAQVADSTGAPFRLMSGPPAQA